MYPRSTINIVRSHWFLLTVIIIFYSINNFVILTLDNTLPVYDNFGNFKQSFSIYKFFKDLNIRETPPIEIYRQYCHLGDGTRPPLYSIILSLYYRIQNNINADYLAMTNILYFIILLFSSYGIGVRLNSKMTGMLAAFIVSMFPGIFAMSRVLMVDFPLTAMVALSIYLMVLARHFIDAKYCFLFGLSLGLGMLTKVPYIVFILPLLAYYAFISFVKSIKKDRQFIIIGRNLLLALLIGLFIAGPWYLPNLNNVIRRAEAMSLQLYNSPRGSFIDYYISSLSSNLIMPFFFILFLGSFLISLVKKRGALLLLWVLVPLLIFSFSPNKKGRFILPLLPSVALIIAFGITLIRPYLIRKAIIIFVIIFSLFSYFAISYGAISVLPENIFYSSNSIEHGLYCSSRNVNWKIVKISKIILSHSEKERVRNKPINILAIFNIGEVHNGIDYYLSSKGVKVEVDCPAEGDFFDSPPKDAYRDISNFDFVITKDNFKGENAGNIDWIGILTDTFIRNKEDFYSIGFVRALPDGSTVYIYKNRCIEN